MKEKVRKNIFLADKIGQAKTKIFTITKLFFVFPIFCEKDFSI